MRKTISAFVAGLAVAAVPYLLLAKVSAQGADPGVAVGGGGQFQGGPAQLPPGQGVPGGSGGFGQGGPGMQQFPPIMAISNDDSFVYVGAGNILYRLDKASMQVRDQTPIIPKQRAPRQLPPQGGSGGGGQPGESKSSSPRQRLPLDKTVIIEPFAAP